MKNITFLLFVLCLNSAYGKSENERIKMLFIGDSLTEGYGVTREEAYPHLLEKSINAKKTLGETKLKVINAGVSGSTTSSGLERLNWQLKSKPDVLFLALGANDGLRGIPAATSQRNLEKIIIEAEKRNITTILAGMYLPQNYGEQYRNEFAKIFSTLAKKFKVAFIPFLLKDVAREKNKNIEDGIHPNVLGHKTIEKNIRDKVIKVLKSKLSAKAK